MVLDFPYWDIYPSLNQPTSSRSVLIGVPAPLVVPEYVTRPRLRLPKESEPISRNESLESMSEPISRNESLDSMSSGATVTQAMYPQNPQPNNNDDTVERGRSKSPSQSLRRTFSTDTMTSTVTVIQDVSGRSRRRVRFESPSALMKRSSSTDSIVTTFTATYNLRPQEDETSGIGSPRSRSSSVETCIRVPINTPENTASTEADSDSTPLITPKSPKSQPKRRILSMQQMPETAMSFLNIPGERRPSQGSRKKANKAKDAYVPIEDTPDPTDSTLASKKTTAAKAKSGSRLSRSLQKAAERSPEQAVNWKKFLKAKNQGREDRERLETSDDDGQASVQSDTEPGAVPDTPETSPITAHTSMSSPLMTSSRGGGNERTLDDGTPGKQRVCITEGPTLYQIRELNRRQRVRAAERLGNSITRARRTVTNGCPAMLSLKSTLFRNEKPSVKQRLFGTI